MDIQNLAKFEWENEIPFSINDVNKTLHAVIGEGYEPRDKDYVLGLIDYNKENKKWGVSPTGCKHNDAFGTHSFGQVNSIFSINVKAVNENSTQLKITVSARQGNLIGGGNQAYLQRECEKFIDAFSYYLEHKDIVTDWTENYKPQALQRNEQSSGSGCMVIPFILTAGGLLAYLFC